MNQAELLCMEKMKLNLANSYIKMRQYSQAKQSLLSITHTIREGTKKSLKREPLSKFDGTFCSISVFDVLELYLQCIKLKPSSKKKTLPEIAQRLFDHMKKDDFIGNYLNNVDEELENKSSNNELCSGIW